jgi:polyisoprenoid-binding protein YceI
MKLIKFAIPSFVALVGLYAFSPKATPVTEMNYKASTEKSIINWSGSKKNGFHPGTLNIKSGGLNIENGKITAGEFVIDMNSIKVTDGAGEKLAGHLKADDFFSVAKFGEATYSFNKVNYTSDNTAEIDGNLSIKGLSVPVKLTANIRGNDDKGFFAEAFFSLDKNAIGIAYGAGYLSNDIQVSVHLYANK